MAAARPPPRGEGADFPVLHPPRVGQSPGGFPGATLPAAPTPGTGRAREVGQTSLWRRTALRPLSAPAPPPEVGGEPSLHPPSVAPASWPAQEPPGWNHHPKPPAPTGQAYWDGEPTWPGTAVAVALWWPPTLPLGRERPAYAPSRPARPPGLPDPAGIRRFQGRSPPYVLQTPLPGRPPSRGGEPEARPSPPLVPRPALRVEAPRVPVQAFGSRSQGDAPSDTTGHQVPRWEPEGTPSRLVSPSGAAAYVPEPSGFPRTAQVSPAYAFRHHPGPPTRPAARAQRLPR